MAQWVTCSTLDFSSGHDLMVHGIELHAAPAWDFLSLPLPLFVSLKINKLFKKGIGIMNIMRSKILYMKQWLKV